MRHREEAEEESGGISRRLLLKRAGALGLLAAIPSLLAACAGRASHPGPSAGTQPSVLSGELIDLVISERSFTVDGRAGTAMTINGVADRLWISCRRFPAREVRNLETSAAPSSTGCGCHKTG